MYTMMQVCRELNMTYQTLKYYCNEGLVPNVKRDGNNRRIFDEKDVKWIKDLTCLKKCGLSIQEMKEYLELCLEGESTIIPRKEMLKKKQETLRISISPRALHLLQNPDTFTVADKYRQKQNARRMIFFPLKSYVPKNVYMICGISDHHIACPD